jgi:hypothetical protein
MPSPPSPYLAEKKRVKVVDALSEYLAELRGMVRMLEIAQETLQWDEDDEQLKKAA